MGVSVAYRNAPRGAEFMKDLYAVCAITTEHVKSVNSEHGQDCCQPAVLGLTYQCLGGCHQLLQVRTALKLMDHVCQHWAILLSKWGNSKAVKHRLQAYSIDSSLVTSRYDSSDWLLDHRDTSPIIICPDASTTTENVLRMMASCLRKTVYLQVVSQWEHCAGRFDGLFAMTKHNKQDFRRVRTGFCDVFMMSFYALFLFLWYLKWWDTLAWVRTMYQMRHNDKKRMY